MERRKFISLFGGAAIAWPIAARGQQQGRVASIGILAIEAWRPIDTFRRTLSDFGYVEGKNVRFEQRHARERYERCPELAHDLVSLSVGNNRSAE